MRLIVSFLFVFVFCVVFQYFGQLKPFQINKAGQFVYKENARYNLKYIDIEQGLSSSFINSMTEDDVGNMWFATWGGGLMKYDGISIDIYNNYSGLPSNIITSVKQFKNGLTLLFENKGIYTLKNKRFTECVPSSKKNNIDKQYAIDDELWFTTTDSNLYKLNDKNKLVNLNKLFSIPKTTVFQITKHNNGTIYLATNLGLIKIERNKTTILNKTNGFPFQNVNCFLITKNNKLLVSDRKNVYYSKKGKFNKLVQQNESFKDVLTILEDKNNHYWFRTYSNGVFRYDGQKTLHLTKENGLTNDEIWNIYCDKQNNIWIAPRAGGVCRFDGDYLKHFTEEDGISGRVVWSLAKNKSTQTYYFGTIKGGITEFDGNTFKPFSLNHKLIDRSIRSLFVDSKQNLWIGTISGIMCYTNKKELQIFNENSFSNISTIFKFVEDKSNTIWVCHEKGIDCIKNNKTYKPFKNNKLNTIKNIGSILFDKNNYKWIASDEGVVCLDKNEKEQNKFITDSIKQDAICLYEDTKNRIWIGTRNGIYVIDGKKTKHFTQVNGLSSDIVWSIAEDKFGSIWAGTEFGLSKIDLNGTKVKIEIISNPEGFTGGDCTQNGLLIDENGLFWWGTSKKLTVLDPEKFIKFHYNPKIQLKNIVLNYKTMNISKQLDLNYYDNNFTFEVSAIDWGNETKLKYQFFLKGYDSKWTPLLAENKITYSNLPPGDYTLQVSSTSNTGLKSKLLKYKFYIKPAFWQTTIFKLFVILSFFFSLFLILKFRVKALEKNKKKLEKIIKERTSEIISQNEILEHKNNEITKSIQYAKRIQSAILPQPKLVKEFLEDSFILYKPKDIVAGDFYWLEVVGDIVLFAAADCTGHGVPGAMVSVVCNNGLNRAVREHNLKEPDQILNKTRELVVQEFEKSDENVMDGMDISLCALDTNTNMLSWSGAHNPLWVLRKTNYGNSQILEIKADKQPIGKFSKATPFTVHQLQLQKEDVIYIFTDGFQDQFGGPKEKKFRAAQMKELFLFLNDKSMEEQRKIIDENFETWKGNLEQVDDVCVIGVRV